MTLDVVLIYMNCIEEVQFICHDMDNDFCSSSVKKQRENKNILMESNERIKTRATYEAWGHLMSFNF